MFSKLKTIHEITGLISSLLILIMCITGFLLNNKSIIGYSTDTELNIQKFIFALHTGTIGNISIVWLINIGALCMIICTITGIIMWVNIRYVKSKNTLKQ
ncbi:MAG: hypothetical protein ABF633_13730 [Clostridium sp.]|uniref:hypothetical protein n=1 Tax=Clostridium sp. TaxID=1506 RepID=UPI0039EB26D2